MLQTSAFQDYVLSSNIIPSSEKEYFNSLFTTEGGSKINEIFKLIGPANIDKRNKLMCAYIDFVLGRFKTIQYLEKGAVAHIFKSVQLSLDKIVSIKVIFDWEQESKIVNGLLEEAKIVAKLNHPNIVQVMDAGRHDTFSYMIMEYLECTSVSAMIEKHGQLEEELAIDIVTQICMALDYALKKGYVHRDVKPSNFLIVKDGTVKLCDLGLAKEVIDLEKISNKIAGSPYYISPEQIKCEKIGATNDIYSLGASFYHMLVGRPPFLADSIDSLFNKHISQNPIPIDIANPKINKKISDIVSKCLSKDKNKRYQSYEELLNDLGSINSITKPRVSRTKLIRRFWK